MSDDDAHGNDGESDKGGGSSFMLYYLIAPQVARYIMDGAGKRWGRRPAIALTMLFLALSGVYLVSEQVFASGPNLYSLLNAPVQGDARVYRKAYKAVRTNRYARGAGSGRARTPCARPCLGPRATHAPGGVTPHPCSAWRDCAVHP